jgi:hypothetical protein
LRGIFRIKGDLQMFSSRDAFDNDACPVADDLLGQMYRANPNGLSLLVANVAPDARARLALFCYRRNHLHPLALAIATSCSERELAYFGGHVGSTLYKLSRQPTRTATPAHSGRKPITLSTKPLATFVPIVDELDEEEVAEAVTA